MLSRGFKTCSGVWIKVGASCAVAQVRCVEVREKPGGRGGQNVTGICVYAAWKEALLAA